MYIIVIHGVGSSYETKIPFCSNTATNLPIFTDDNQFPTSSTVHDFSQELSGGDASFLNLPLCLNFVECDTTAHKKIWFKKRYCNSGCNKSLHSDSAKIQAATLTVNKTLLLGTCLCMWTYGGEWEYCDCESISFTFSECSRSISAICFRSLCSACINFLKSVKKQVVCVL